MAESNIQRILDYAREQHATDIHIHAGSPVLFRIGRELTPATQARLSEDTAHKLAIELLDRGSIEYSLTNHDYDFMVGEGDRRYRVNVGQFNNKLGAVIRILPERPGTPEELKLPPILAELCELTKGLILITGRDQPGGKTTTMASIIDQINTHARKHIVTIEDPIEYVHADKQGIVRQREVGRDTPTFAQGLRAALRQDPDVIAIGEMRDYDTIKIALTAAETGILVISTLHTMSIDKIIERILSYVPPEEESHIRYVMADRPACRRRCTRSWFRLSKAASGWRARCSSPPTRAGTYHAPARACSCCATSSPRGVGTT